MGARLHQNTAMNMCYELRMYMYIYMHVHVYNMFHIKVHVAVLQ